MALQEFHCTTGTNEQTVNIGDVVQIHDDTPRSRWKLSVMEGLNRVNDGYIRSVTVHTASGRTNRPIAHLYPLEVSVNECSVNKGSEELSQQGIDQQDVHDSQDITSQQQPVRRAMIKARDQVTEWTKMLCCPPWRMWKILTLNYI